MFIKSAVVTDETPCIDDKSRRGFIFDGEKVASARSCEDAPKLSKILNQKEKTNELEYPESV